METIDIAEACKRIGCGRPAITKMLHTRRLTGFRHHSGRWEISVRSVNEVIRKRREAHRQ